MPVDPAAKPESRLRRMAEFELIKRQDVAIHLAAYVAVSVLLIAIWAFAGGGEFWPLIPIVVWGGFVALHAWAIHRPDRDKGDGVAAEMERLRDHGPEH
jgi:hypothetical protein